ncbi:hypothetical protein PPERSA_11710 [Pseudocohnilembus persalinus]|uniref:Tubulin-tyrosine ligase/Tubulin polyglutamylase n=1 Tax=Pseudocohnilembus persalinus TaxID=266149 RepID=A0A0V0QGF0_PSEPJ|nr:hypothetical protein PPERSA_11710 [Pseudocohnilembus persalinus]|eukprot:KRX01263.1 hypothetical protein PPERSA_11710 [Pseudocohnilembus persalinus]
MQLRLNYQENLESTQDGEKPENQQNNQQNQNNNPKEKTVKQLNPQSSNSSQNSKSSKQEEEFPYMTLQDVINMPRKIKRSKKAVFDAQDLRYEVIKDVVQVIYQWQIIYQTPANKEDWYIQWLDSYIYEEEFKRMLSFQKVNHFLGSHHLAKKNFLAQNLQKMQNLFPEEYNFYPKTWTLPMMFEDFKKYSEMSKNRNKYYIVKPESACQGRGIHMIKKNEGVNPNDHVIIQEYLSNPLTLDNLKFDFRIYVLLRSLNPLRIYMYPEGLTRLATTKYQEPNKQNSQNLTMHLTNYAVNKRNANFQYNMNEENDNIGHKRSFTAVLKELYQQGRDVNTLYMEIRQIIVKSIIAAQPQMSYLYKHCQPKEKVTDMCFEVLGFDIMVDNNMKPWLIEINHSPSFTTDTPLDLQIKRHLVIDTFNIINISTKSKKSYLEQKMHKTNQANQKLVSPKADANTDEKTKAYLKEVQEFEINHRGAYQLIYPSQDDPINYNKFFDGAKKANPDPAKIKRTLLEPVLPKREYYINKIANQSNSNNQINGGNSTQNGFYQGGRKKNISDKKQSNDISYQREKMSYNESDLKENMNSEYIGQSQNSNKMGNYNNGQPFEDNQNKIYNVRATNSNGKSINYNNSGKNLNLELNNFQNNQINFENLNQYNTQEFQKQYSQQSQQGNPNISSRNVGSVKNTSKSSNSNNNKQNPYQKNNIEQIAKIYSQKRKPLKSQQKKKNSITKINMTETTSLSNFSNIQHLKYVTFTDCSKSEFR